MPVSPNALLLYGSDLKSGAINAVRQWLTPLNAVVKRTANKVKKQTVEVPKEWGGKSGEYISLVNYNKTSPVETLIRVMLLLHYYPMTFQSQVASYRFLDSQESETGEPITLAIIIGGIALALTQLGPIIVPMVTKVISDVTNSGKEAEEKAAKAETKKAEAQSKKMFAIAAAATIVVILGATIYAVRK
jgi:hypothetical protein